VIALLAFLAQSGIDWRTDYDAARLEAREKGRRIVLHFFMTGRPICRAMDEETFGQAEVRQVIRDQFIGVRLDVEARPELFEAAIGSRGVLATCVMDGDGDVLSELRGFSGPQAFLRFLARAEIGYAAVKAAREALAAAPGDAVRSYALAEAYREAGSPRRAEECYRKVLDGSSASPCLRSTARIRPSVSRSRSTAVALPSGSSLRAASRCVRASRFLPRITWRRASRSWLAATAGDPEAPSRTFR